MSHSKHHYTIIPHPSSLLAFHPSTTSLPLLPHDYSFTSLFNSEIVIYNINFDLTERDGKLFHYSKMAIKVLDKSITVTSLCYTHHGNNLLLSTTSGELIILGLDLHIQQTIKLHTLACTGVISTPDGHIYTIGNDGTMRKGTLNSIHWECLEFSFPLTSIIYNSEHNCAIMGTSHNDIIILNFHTNEQQTLKITNTSNIGEIKSLATIGDFIAAGDQSGQVIIWNLKKLYEPIARHFFNHPVTNIRFHPMNHSYLFCSTTTGDLTMNTILIDLNYSSNCLWRLPKVYNNSGINYLEIKDSMIIIGTDTFTLLCYMTLEPRDKNVIKDLLFDTKQII